MSLGAECSLRLLVEKVGRLLADDREDLVPEAISDYADEALREIVASKAA